MGIIGRDDGDKRRPLTHREIDRIKRAKRKIAEQAHCKCGNEISKLRMLNGSDECRACERRRFKVEWAP